MTVMENVPGPDPVRKYDGVNSAIIEKRRFLQN
jgi:hypothetical protein